MFADDEKNEMEEQEQDAGQPEEGSFDAERTLLDSTPSVEAAPAEKKKPPAPKKKPATSGEKTKEADDAWQTVASTPAQKAAEPTVEKKAKSATPQPKAEFAPTTPLEAVGAAGEGSESTSKVPLGDFLSNLGIKDQTWQIVVLAVAGLTLLCCLCVCVGGAASLLLGGSGY
jgi:hypothetical protein